MPEQKKHEPWNFLLVDVRQAGVEMIELVGIATGYEYTERKIPPHLIDEMETNANKALRAIASYRGAVAQNHARMTRDEFSALSQTKGLGTT